MALSLRLEMAKELIVGRMNIGEMSRCSFPLQKHCPLFEWLQNLHHSFEHIPIFR